MPVVPISAAKNEGIDELIEHAAATRPSTSSAPAGMDFCGGAGAAAAFTASAAHDGETTRRRAGYAAVCSPPPSWSRATRPMQQRLRADAEERNRSCRPFVAADGGRAVARTARPPWPTCATPLLKSCAPQGGGKARRKPRARAQRKRSTRVLTGTIYWPFPFFWLLCSLIFWLTFGVDRRVSAATCWRGASAPLTAAAAAGLTPTASTRWCTRSDRSTACLRAWAACSAFCPLL